MTSVVLDIDFGETGNSRDYVLEGWGEPEAAHSWSIGPQSWLRLPVTDPEARYTLVFRAKPWTSPPHVQHQTIMLGADDRLVGTFALATDAALAFDLPAPRSEGGSAYLVSFGHLDSARSSVIDTYRDGSSMGLMMRSMRLIARAGTPVQAPAFMPPLPGNLDDGSLLAAAERATGCEAASFLGCFESLGQWCGLPDLQQRLGCNQLGLLRYAGLHLPDLTEGLFRRFRGIGNVSYLEAFQRPGATHVWDVHDRLYRVWWHTEWSTAEVDADDVVAFEARRLPYLQRKFDTTLSGGRRILVLPAAATELEVLAVKAALDVGGSGMFLHTSQSGRAPAGSVERLSDGRLRAYLDWTPEQDCGTDAVWVSVLANAHRLCHSR